MVGCDGGRSLIRKAAGIEFAGWDAATSSLIAEAETSEDGLRLADIHMRLDEIDAASAPSRAAAILSGLGFDNEAQQRACGEFSGGWRMRVALAGTLFSSPDLLILDEPSEGLDPLMQRSLQELLLERVAAGRTVFFSSHLISEVERICNRVAIVRSGRLVALETIESLVRLRRRRHRHCKMMELMVVHFRQNILGPVFLHQGCDFAFHFQFAIFNDGHAITHALGNFQNVG